MPGNNERMRGLKLHNETDLHPYQKFCVDFIEEHPNCGVFLDMGLGKTIISLTAISHLLYDSYEVSRVLIIAPLRVARVTWVAELDKWEHLKGLRMERIIGTLPIMERSTSLARQQAASVGSASLKHTMCLIMVSYHQINFHLNYSIFSMKNQEKTERFVGIFV